MQKASSPRQKLKISATPLINAGGKVAVGRYFSSFIRASRSFCRSSWP